MVGNFDISKRFKIFIGIFGVLEVNGIKRNRLSENTHTETLFRISCIDMISEFSLYLCSHFSELHIEHFTLMFKIII